MTRRGNLALILTRVNGQGDDRSTSKRACKSVQQHMHTWTETTRQLLTNTLFLNNFNASVYRCPGVNHNLSIGPIPEGITSIK